MPRASPPTPWMKRRRLSLTRKIWFMVVSSGAQAAGGFVDRRADAHIGGAAADVAAHGGVDVGVAGCVVGLEQGGGGHDLPGLAVAALHHVELLPGGLHRMADLVGADGFDRGDLLAGGGGDRGDAGTDGL